MKSENILTGGWRSCRMCNKGRQGDMRETATEEEIRHYLRLINAAKKTQLKLRDDVSIEMRDNRTKLKVCDLCKCLLELSAVKAEYSRCIAEKEKNKRVRPRHSKVNALQVNTEKKRKERVRLRHSKVNALQASNEIKQDLKNMLDGKGPYQIPSFYKLNEQDEEVICYENGKLFFYHIGPQDEEPTGVARGNKFPHGVTIEFLAKELCGHTSNNLTKDQLLTCFTKFEQEGGYTKKKKPPAKKKKPAAKKKKVRKIHKGPRGGKYYISKGRKVYI